MNRGEILSVPTGETEKVKLSADSCRFNRTCVTET